MSKLLNVCFEYLDEIETKLHQGQEISETLGVLLSEDKTKHTDLHVHALVLVGNSIRSINDRDRELNMSAIRDEVIKRHELLFEGWEKDKFGSMYSKEFTTIADKVAFLKAASETGALKVKTPNNMPLEDSGVLVAVLNKSEYVKLLSFAGETRANQR